MLRVPPRSALPAHGEAGVVRTALLTRGPWAGAGGLASPQLFVVSALQLKLKCRL